MIISFFFFPWEDSPHLANHWCSDDFSLVCAKPLPFPPHGSRRDSDNDPWLGCHDMQTVVDHRIASITICNLQRVNSTVARGGLDDDLMHSYRDSIEMFGLFVTGVCLCVHTPCTACPVWFFLFAWVVLLVCSWAFLFQGEPHHYHSKTQWHKITTNAVFHFASSTQSFNTRKPFIAQFWHPFNGTDFHQLGLWMAQLSIHFRM